MNVSTGSNAHYLFERLVEENAGWNFTLNKKDCDLMYLSHVPREEELYDMLMTQKNLVINRYPNVKLVSRKDTLQRMMDMAADFNSEAFDFIPLTFVLPQDMKKF